MFFICVPFCVAWNPPPDDLYVFAGSSAMIQSQILCKQSRLLIRSEPAIMRGSDVPTRAICADWPIGTLMPIGSGLELALRFL